MANTNTNNTVLTVCLLIHNKRQAGTARPTAIMTSADGIKYFQTLSLSDYYNHYRQFKSIR